MTDIEAKVILAMGSLEVLFEVPDAILQGLASGTLKRVGGVIVDSSTNHIVAWLREGNAVETAVKLVGSGINPLQLILEAASTASTLVDGHMTRKAVHVLTQQVGSLANMTTAGQVINLAFTHMTFMRIMSRLDSISSEIATLSETIKSEFNRDRELRFRTALQAAQDMLDSDSTATQRDASNRAIYGLYEARENFLTDCKNILEEANSLEHLQVAQHYLQLALYAEISRIRCYVVTDGVKRAEARLSEAMPVLEEKVKKLIQLWIGERSALFFHKDVSPELLNRYLYIQQWLQGITHGKDANMLFSIVDGLRADFWNTELIKDEYQNVLEIVTRRPTVNKNSRVTSLSVAVDQAELLIENFERLQGLELELQSVEASFEDWSHLVAPEDLEENPLAVIVDTERLARLQASEMA